MQGTGHKTRWRRRGFATIAAATSLALVAPWTTSAAGASTTAQRPAGASGGALATLEVESAGVEVNPAGKGGWSSAKSGRDLKAGDAVRTDETGQAQISYTDGSLTRLDVDTEYKLVKLSDKKGDRKTKGVQTAGQTWHRVEKLADDDSYKVEGANATAAVLGTAFVVKCVSRNQCTFTAVIDPIQLTDPGPRNGTKTVTLTPGDEAIVSDDAIGPITTLTQEDLLAIQWIVDNLLADEEEGKSTGTAELGAQPDPPPTRPASSPVQDPPPPAPPANAGTGTGTGAGTEEVAANQGPTAENDAYSMPEDTLLVIAAPGVLGNDSDPEGNPLELFLTGLPAHGSLTVFPDGAFIYFPDANFTGTDSWTYVAGDGEFGSNVATVTITVTPQNDAPVANDDAYEVAEDGVLNVPAPGVLGNDTDVDGNPLTAEGDFAPADYPANGSLTLNPNGSFTYEPASDFFGTDSFTYRASDGSLESNVATVTITVTPVDDAPVAVADAYSVDEDTPLVVTAAEGVLVNDSDPDDDPLTAQQVVAEEGDGPDHGTVSLDSDGSFTYTPTDDFHGTDHFTYYAHDGNGPSNTVEVTITVDSVEDVPVAVDDDAYTTDEDTQLVVTVAEGVLDNDTDGDGDPLTADIVVNALGVFEEEGVPTAHGTVALAEDGSFVYTPDPNFAGEDSFEYIATDGTNDSEPATVTITVGPVGDAPVAEDDGYTTDEDTQLVVISAEGLLTNDSDPDDDTLTVVWPNEEPYDLVGPGHGILTPDVDGGFTYTPDANWSGEDSFTYYVTDGVANSAPATVTITVNPVNDAPYVGDDEYFADEDTELVVPVVDGVLANDGDVDEGDTFTAEVATPPSHGDLVLAPDGSFTYTPDDGFFGDDSFTYLATDGTLDSSVATVTIHVDQFLLPNAWPKIHELAAGDSVSFVVDTYEATGASIDSLPTGGGLDEGIEVGDEIGDTLLTYFAPETPGVYSFTWHATNADGDSTTATEYFVVGLPPVMPDIFFYAPPGGSSYGEVSIDLPYGLPDATCATSMFDPSFGFSQFVFGEGGEIVGLVFRYTTPAEVTPQVLAFEVNACFGDGFTVIDLGGGNYQVTDTGSPEANLDPGTTVYVGVGYGLGAGEGGAFLPVDPPVAFFVDPVPEVETPDLAYVEVPQGEDVTFTIDASDPNGLPLDVSLESFTGPTGTLEVVAPTGSSTVWTLTWTPNPCSAAANEVTVKVRNLAGRDVFLTLLVEYVPGGGCDL